MNICITSYLLIRKSPKRFWSLIKSKNCYNVGVAPLKGQNGRLCVDANSISEILNTQFSSLFTKSENKAILSNKSKSHVEAMPEIRVGTSGMYKLLKNLKVHNATGPDGISSRLLKETALQVTLTRTLLFQVSLSQGSVPDEWKQLTLLLSSRREINTKPRTTNQYR